MELPKGVDYDPMIELPVTLNIKLGECGVLTQKLLTCGCQSCLLLADTIVSAISDSVLQSDLTPVLSSVADQWICANRTRVRSVLVAKHYMHHRQPEVKSLEMGMKLSERITAVLHELDLTLPADELLASTAAVAQADAMRARDQEGGE